MQELSVFSEEILRQCKVIEQKNDIVSRLSVDLDASKEQLKDEEQRQKVLQDELAKLVQQNNQKSRNIEQLEFRLITMKRNRKFPDILKCHGTHVVYTNS